MEVESAKRQLEATEVEQTGDAKRARSSKPREEVLEQCKRQIEYYLSDENLKYDAFFQKSIKESEEQWLPLTAVLSCRRIQQLAVTAEDIAEALKDSQMVELRKEDQDGPPTAVRRSGCRPLPALEERPARKQLPSKENRSDDHHAAGCLLKITNLPEEAGWEMVKTELGKRLPPPFEKPQTEEEKASGRKPYVEYPIKFVSQPNASGTCYAHVGPFANDQELIKAWEPMEINGQSVPVGLITEFSEAMNFIRSMPSVLQKRRERDIARKRAEVNSKPILLGGAEFASIDHLKKCLKEVMSASAPGKTVNRKTALVLEDLLKYHPTGAKKLEKYAGFKVDVSDKATKSGETTRCFFVLKNDGTTEDFSLQKCYLELTKNPPFVEAKTEEAEEAAKAAETQTGGETKEETTKAEDEAPASEAATAPGSETAANAAE